MRFPPTAAGRIPGLMLAFLLGVTPVLRADATTRPAARAGPDAVLILPFQPVSGRAGETWIGRSIQQSLLSDLVAGGAGPASTSDAASADAAAALDAGRKAGARYVISGLLHLNDRADGTALRVTALVLDTATGRAAATLKSTGTLDNLFPLEDDLADQTRAQLDRLAGPRSYGRGDLPPGPPPAIEWSGPVRAWEGFDDRYVPAPVVPPAAAYRYYYGNPYYYGPYYGYPGYGYGWGSYFGYFSYGTTAPATAAPVIPTPTARTISRLGRPGLGTPVAGPILPVVPGTASPRTVYGHVFSTRAGAAQSAR